MKVQKIIVKGEVNPKGLSDEPQAHLKGEGFDGVLVLTSREDGMGVSYKSQARISSHCHGEHQIIQGSPKLI